MGSFFEGFNSRELFFIKSAIFPLIHRVKTTLQAERFFLASPLVCTMSFASLVFRVVGLHCLRAQQREIPETRTLGTEVKPNSTFQRKPFLVPRKETILPKRILTVCHS